MASDCFDYEYCVLVAGGQPIRTSGGDICWMGAQHALEVARNLYARDDLGLIFRRPLGEKIGLIDLVMGLEPASSRHVPPPPPRSGKLPASTEMRF